MNIGMGRKRIGGSFFCIEDCLVWTEIQYLDSPTDYRECLPRNGATSQVVSHDEVNLDSFEHLLRAGTGVLLGLLICILLVAVGWLFYSC